MVRPFTCLIGVFVAIHKDLARYMSLERDPTLHERHRNLIAAANRLLNGGCYEDGTPDPTRPGMRSVVVGPSLERVPLALVIGLFARGDSGPGFIAKVRKQVRGEVVEEVVPRAPSSVCGHVLIEGLPGGGKTLLAKTGAALSDLAFGRKQMTPDATPRDLGARRVQEGNEVHTYFGVVMLNNIVLADEINRATPKTQSALLEAMSEGQVTYEEGGNLITRYLKEPFIVLATQNPIEQGEGTYNLPAAQLDRFMFRILLDLPDEETIDAVLDLDHSNMVVRPLTTGAAILDARDFIATEVETPPRIKQYIKRLIMACYDPLQYREIFPDIRAELEGTNLVVLPPNSRAALHLRNCSQAIAAVDGCRVVDPYHVKKRFFEVVNHRFILNKNLRQRYNDLGGVQEFIRVLIKGDPKTGRKGILDVVPVD